MTQISADAGLEVRLGNLELAARAVPDVVSRFERALTRPAVQPFYFPRVGSVVIPTPTADAVIDLGGPTQGRVWDLRNLIIGGLNWTTTAAGSALVVVAAQQPARASDVGLPAVVDQAATLPLPAGYSRGQIRLYYPDRLYVIVQLGTQAQEYVAGARLEEYEEARRVQVADAG